MFCHLASESAIYALVDPHVIDSDKLRYTTDAGLQYFDIDLYMYIVTYIV